MRYPEEPIPSHIDIDIYTRTRKYMSKTEVSRLDRKVIPRTSFIFHQWLRLRSFWSWEF